MWDSYALSLLLVHQSIIIVQQAAFLHSCKSTHVCRGVQMGGHWVGYHSQENGFDGCTSKLSSDQAATKVNSEVKELVKISMSQKRIWTFGVCSRFNVSKDLKMTRNRKMKILDHRKHDIALKCEYTSKLQKLCWSFWSADTYILRKDTLMTTPVTTKDGLLILWI